MEKGITPVEVMLDNMRHWHKTALDAEAVLLSLSADDLAERAGENPKHQFDYMLAEVKRTVGLRQSAQDAARDAAPYIHPRLAAVEHTGAAGGPIEMMLAARDMTDDELAAVIAGSVKGS